MTQKEAIEYLKQHGSIRASEADKKLGCKNFATIVHEINKSGRYYIRSKMVGKVTFDWHKQDKTDTVYTLERKPVQIKDILPEVLTEIEKNMEGERKKKAG